MSSNSSTLHDVVEAPAVSGKDILVMLEEELDAPQDLSLYETGGQVVAIQLLNKS